MAEATLVGIHHVKFPVTDLARSRPWYEQLFGLTPEIEFPDDDGVVRGVAYEPTDAGITFSLRENPAAAQGIAGFDPVSFAIADRAAAEAWITRLDELGIEHSPVIDATIGWLVVFNDPDGTELHLYSIERHGLDPSSRRGTGRLVHTDDSEAVSVR